MENNTFKGSLFGGFNREDVIDYIKKTSAESTARIESLEGDIDKLCTQEQELRTQVSTLRGENDRLTQEHSDAAAERDTLRAALDAANDELTALRAEAEALRAENASLRAENDKLRPMAEQYSTIKEHLAGIELDAHQRAEEYERGVHERLAAMIGDCRAHCDSARQHLHQCDRRASARRKQHLLPARCLQRAARRSGKAGRGQVTLLRKRELCAAAQSSLFIFGFYFMPLSFTSSSSSATVPSMPRSDESMHMS